jgi:outer membrane protein, heavy metal efflux system
VRALGNYHRLVNEIERLIAAPIDGVSNGIANSPVINGNRADKDLRSRL